MQRAFPNLLTREGVLGHEWNMWSERATPDHALTVPFVRMAAGPMDWEGGSMRNGLNADRSAADYRIDTQDRGTRHHPHATPDPGGRLRRALRGRSSASAAGR